jgi:hypothetical protein
MSYLDLNDIFNHIGPHSAILELESRINAMTNGSNLDELTTAQKIVFFVSNLEKELNNGGFNQFYWNTSGDYVSETVEALKSIGANKAITIIEKANSVWRDSNVPKTQDERQQIFLEIEATAEDIWDNCDQEYLQYEQDITKLLFTYAKDNQEEFQGLES